MNGKIMLLLLGSIFLLHYCKLPAPILPILGETEISNGDTIYHTIPPFSFVDQNGDTVNENTVKGKIYITDFFFTHCPTICPKMAQQMHDLHEKYKNNADVLFLSHSIDSKYDTVATLKKYAEKLNVADSKTWHFLHVPADQLFDRARSYLTAVQKDSTESAGFTHSGHFVLVDRNRHIRAYCDGTKPEDVSILKRKIDQLLNEPY